MNRMKRGKASGPGEISVEVWRCLGERAVHFLTTLFNTNFNQESRKRCSGPDFKSTGAEL